MKSERTLLGTYQVSSARFGHSSIKMHVFKFFTPYGASDFILRAQSIYSNIITYRKNGVVWALKIGSR